MPDSPAFVSPKADELQKEMAVRMGGRSDLDGACFEADLGVWGVRNFHIESKASKLHALGVC